MKQKMKKRWLVIIALAVIAVVGGVLLYPAKPIQAAHTHSYRWVTKKNATCTSEGYRNYECSCGACMRSETIPKTPHNYNLNAATCTTAKKCRTCGYVAQAATGHSWNRASATCTASKSCTKCGAVGQAALGHAYCQVTTKQPTCGAAGTYETKCSRCGIGSPTGNGTIPPTGQHTWNRSAASCTEAKKCVNCGTVGQAALGHAYRQVTTKQPTCGAEGTYETKCSRCGIGSPTGNGTIAPTGQHTWTYTSTTQPTCTANGYDLYTCSTCKQTKKETIEKLGHAYSQVTTKQPTCGAEGAYETKCSRCGIGSPTGNGTIAPTGKHTWKYTSTTESTCTANGYDLYTCSVCKQTKKETLDRIEHEYRLVVTKQPTKTENGVQSYMCSHCDAVKWTKALYLVSYDGNGAIKGTTPGNQTKVAGSTLTLSIVAPRRTGYNFKGWGTTTSEVKYQPGDTYDKNARMNLYAIWEPYQYTIEFDVNGGIGSNFTRTIAYGSTYSKVDKPSRTGYTFAGWYTAKTGGSQITETTIMSTAKDHTVYARWTAKTYTVTFDANGGTGGPTSMKKTYGKASVIPEEVPTLPGYECIGWADSLADAKAKKVSGRPGEYFTRNKKMTLYAVWDRYDFFSHNERFKKTSKIQVPYNSAVESASKIKPEHYMALYKERGSKYNTDKLPDGLYILDIIERCKYLATVGLVGKVSPIPEATGMLGHYLYGDGSRYTYDARRFVVGGSGVAPDRYNQEINAVMREMEKTLLPGEEITFTDKNAADNHITFMAVKNGLANDLLEFNNFFAVKEGSIGISATGFRTMDGVFHLDYYYFVQDYYDFYYPTGDKNSQAENNVLGVYVDELAYLAAFELVHPFESCGVYHVAVNWYPGQVVDIQLQDGALIEDGVIAQVFNLGYSEEDLFK